MGLGDGSRVPCPIPMLEKVVVHGGTHLSFQLQRGKDSGSLGFTGQSA